MTTPFKAGRRRAAIRFGLRPTLLAARLKTYTTPWDAAVLHTFGTVEAGIDPSGPLQFASDGYLYGTTSAGGNEKGFLSAGPGTVFRLAP